MRLKFLSLNVRNVLLAAAVLTFAPTLPAQGAPEPLHTASQQELDIVKVLLAQEGAWNRGDIEGFARGYKDSPDTIFLSRQLSRGYAGLIEQYHHDYPTKAAMGTLAFSDLEVRPLDDHFAVCLGKYELDRSKKEGGHAEGLFSLIFEKTDKGWKIIIDHTT
jgi:ketosteroid isomerase-like protein